MIADKRIFSKSIRGLNRRPPSFTLFLSILCAAFDSLNKIGFASYMIQHLLNVVKGGLTKELTKGSVSFILFS